MKKTPKAQRTIKLNKQTISLIQDPHISDFAPPTAINCDGGTDGCTGISFKVQTHCMCMHDLQTQLIGCKEEIVD